MERAESDAAAARDGQQVAEEEVRRVKAAQQVAERAAWGAKEAQQVAQEEVRQVMAVAAEAKAAQQVAQYLLLSTYH